MLKRAFSRIAMLLALLVLLAPALRSQAAASIAVIGDIPRPLALTTADLASMPRAKATISSNGIETVYEGVWLSDVLKRAGVPLGPNLRGAPLAGYVLASASDGYQVVF